MPEAPIITAFSGRVVITIKLIIPPNKKPTTGNKNNPNVVVRKYEKGINRKRLLETWPISP